LCRPECPGLTADAGKAHSQSNATEAEFSSVWAKLDKLKL